MSLYQDYRPLTFDKVLGHGESIQIIKRQMALGRPHHSYLLHGASGTGKTTTARIIAMSLNCEHKVNGEPCGQCQPCQSIKAGYNADVIEVDATRTRGIDDVKELCNKAQYAPWAGKFKVYIIDECHQYGMPSWSAMLKLLEEPPPYLVIILCTTDFNDIPETIRSRCQCVEFGKLAVESVMVKLAHISNDLRMGADYIVLRSIAEACGGNMRTAENMLEQQSYLMAPPPSVALMVVG